MNYDYQAYLDEKRLFEKHACGIFFNKDSCLYSVGKFFDHAFNIYLDTDRLRLSFLSYIDHGTYCNLTLNQLLQIISPSNKNIVVSDIKQCIGTYGCPNLIQFYSVPATCKEFDDIVTIEFVYNCVPEKFSTSLYSTDLPVYQRNSDEVEFKTMVSFNCKDCGYDLRNKILVEKTHQNAKHIDTKIFIESSGARIPFIINGGFISDDAFDNNPNALSKINFYELDEESYAYYVSEYSHIFNDEQIVTEYRIDKNEYDAYKAFKNKDVPKIQNANDPKFEIYEDNDEIPF